MFFRNLSCLFLLSGFLWASAAHADALEKLRRFAADKTVRANFEQVVTAGGGKKPQFSSGSMAISRPGKFRWQIDKPWPQLIVGDGLKVWAYDPDLRQVTVKKVDAALGSSPAAVLTGTAGSGELEKNFTLRALGASSADGMDWLEAVPKNPESGFEKLRIGFFGDEIRAMELFDAFGQMTRVSFSAIERNPALPASLFNFTPPEGADVIGD